MGRPLKSEARETRRDILDAALDLFAAGGFFGTSMRQIARAVGVRESALYHHFPSKEAILHGLLEELGPGKVEKMVQLDAAAVKKIGVEKALRFFVDRLVEQWATPKEQKLVRIMLSEGPRLGTEGVLHPRAHVGRVRSRISGLFAELVRLKAIRPVDPDTAALALMGPLIMLRIMHLALSGGPPDLRAMKREVDAFVHHFAVSLQKT